MAERITKLIMNVANQIEKMNEEYKKQVVNIEDSKNSKKEI